MGVLVVWAPSVYHVYLSLEDGCLLIVSYLLFCRVPLKNKKAFCLPSSSNLLPVDVTWTFVVC